jgi:hypothetical protein
LLRNDLSCSDLSIFNNFFMQDKKGQSGQTNKSSLAAGDAASSGVSDPHAAEVIRNFILFYPPEAAREVLWQLLSAGMSGPAADCWCPQERSNILLFYRLAGELVEVLPGLLPKTD